MTENWVANQATTNLPTDAGLHQRLLAMPAANDAPATDEPGFFSFFTAWRERRFAADTCRELMRLHKEVASSHSGVGGEDLYRLVVMLHVGGDQAAAQTLLLRAQESYAMWPEPRALNFRDVAHYLAVSGYWARHHGQRWMCSDVRRVIEASVPRQL